LGRRLEGFEDFPWGAARAEERAERAKQEAEGMQRNNTKRGGGGSGRIFQNFLYLFLHDFYKLNNPLMTKLYYCRPSTQWQGAKQHVLRGLVTCHLQLNPNVVPYSSKRYMVRRLGSRAILAQYDMMLDFF
jgi:hypothetical protein